MRKILLLQMKLLHNFDTTFRIQKWKLKEVHVSRHLHIWCNIFVNIFFEWHTRNFPKYLLTKCLGKWSLRILPSHEAGSKRLTCIRNFSLLTCMPSLCTLLTHTYVKLHVLDRGVQHKPYVDTRTLFRLNFLIKKLKLGTMMQYLCMIVCP